MEILILPLFIYVAYLHRRLGAIDSSLKQLTRHQTSPAPHEITPVSGTTHAKHPELVLYVRNEAASGVALSEIERVLKESGWAADDIAAAMKGAAESSGTEHAAAVSARAEGDTQALGRFWNWLSTDWVMKLGVFLLLIGVGWFVTYAFASGWIGPVGRITLGILFGIAVLILGEWRIKQFRDQGAVFLALGSAIVILTIFAAQFAFGTPMFPPLVALGIMSLSVLYLAVASVRYRLKALAVLSLLLGYSVPILTNSGTNDLIALFNFLFVVTLGTLWVVGVTGWRVLVPLSLVIMFSYSVLARLSLSFGMGGSSGMLDTLLWYGYAFTLLYFAAAVSAMVRTKLAERNDLTTAFATGIFLFWWIMSVVSPDMQSLAFAVWAVVFAIGAFLTYTRTGIKAPFFIYGGIAAALIGAATAAELHGAALTIMLTIESAIATLVAYLLLGRAQAGTSLRTGLLFIAPVLLSFESLNTYLWRSGIPWEHFFVLALLMVSMLGLGNFLRSHAENVEGSTVRLWAGASITIGALYALALIWLVPFALISDKNTATMVTLVCYTLIGLYVYLRGRSDDIRVLRVAGGILLGYVVLHLLFVEVWRFSMGGRIVIFSLIGILLIGTAFLGRSKKELQ